MDIIRIISIVDTREYEEQGDRWVPIPGSGDRSVCARCKREHEVHATVLLANGSTEVVGTGCAARESIALAAEFKRGDSRAKKLAAQRAKVAKMERLAAELVAVRAEVEKLKAPEVTFVDKDSNLREFNCGGVTVWNVSRAEYYTGVDAAIRQWRLRQQSERGITSAHHTAENWIRRERKKLAEMERAVTAG